MSLFEMAKYAFLFEMRQKGAEHTDNGSGIAINMMIAGLCLNRDSNSGLACTKELFIRLTVLI